MKFVVNPGYFHSRGAGGPVEPPLELSTRKLTAMAEDGQGSGDGLVIDGLVNLQS
jgi:hypothetical protein